MRSHPGVMSHKDTGQALWLWVERFPGAVTTELSLLTGHFLWGMGMMGVSQERMEGISGERVEEHRPEEREAQVCTDCCLCSRQKLW